MGSRSAAVSRPDRVGFCRGARLQRGPRWLWWAFLSARIRRQLQRVGPNLLVKGVCRVRNSGTAHFGSEVILDSSWARPIRIEVGPGATLAIGSDTYLNEGVQIVCHVGIEIGEGCLIAPDVVFLDDDGHPLDWRQRADHRPSGPESRCGAPIVIEDHVWLGTRAIILKGVRIGAGAVVAAGAVVTRSVPAATLVAGVPAEVIREI